MTPFSVRVVAVLAVASAAVSTSFLAPAPAEAASTGPFSLTWHRTMPGEVAQSAPVAVQGTTDIAVGATNGTLMIVDRSTGAIPAGWGARATGGTSVNAPLSSGSSARLAVAVSSTKKGAPSFENWNVIVGALGFRVGSCASSCYRLSGLSWAGSTAYTGGPDQYIHAINGNGAQRWQYLSSDSTNSTPATSNLTGYGTSIITTDDQTPNNKVKPAAISGGHLRIFNDAGTQICNADIGTGPAAPGSFDSSPAVGATSAGVPLIVFGTGASGAQPNRLLAYDSACQKEWESGKLAGPTVGAPAIATVGNRSVVYEEVVGPGSSAYLYAFDFTTGTQLAVTHIRNTAGAYCTSFAQGTSASVATMRKGSTQYVFAPAGSCGVEVFTDTYFKTAADLAPACGVQNTPVVTQDTSTVAGVTIAGYTAKPGGGAQGCLFHYRLDGGSAGAGTWPEFHHDPALTGSATAAFAKHATAVSGQNLAAGQGLTSPNGRWTLTVTSSGQMQLKSRGTLVWTVGPVSPGAHLHVSTGAFCLTTSAGKSTWASGGKATGKPLVLELTDSGALNLWSNPGNEWSTPTKLWSKAA